MTKKTKFELVCWTVAAGLTFLILPSAPTVVDPVSTEEAALYVGVIWGILCVLIVVNGGRS